MDIDLTSFQSAARIFSVNVELLGS